MLSTKLFQDWFQCEIVSRWNKCDFNDAQMADWYWRLKGFEPGDLTEAVRRHSALDEPRRPSLRAVYEYARQQQAARPGGGVVRGPAEIPDRGTYIQCVSQDENGRGKVGWFVSVLVTPVHKTHPRDMMQQAAEMLLEQYRQSRGGRWQIVHDATHHQMMVRRWKLTGQYDQIRQAALQFRTLPAKR